MAAMLIRRSLRGELLRRAGPTLLSASKQTEAAAFLSSSSAAGAAARIRTKGQCMYRMLSDGSGISTPVGGDNALFLAKLKDISKGLVERFWTPLPFSEKMSTVYSVLFVGWVVNSMRELNDLEKKIITASQSWGCEKGAGGQNKK